MHTSFVPDHSDAKQFAQPSAGVQRALEKLKTKFNEEQKHFTKERFQEVSKVNAEVSSRKQADRTPGGNAYAPVISEPTSRAVIELKKKVQDLFFGN